MKSRIKFRQSSFHTQKTFSSDYKMMKSSLIFIREANINKDFLMTSIPTFYEELPNEINRSGEKIQIRIKMVWKCSIFKPKFGRKTLPWGTPLKNWNFLLKKFKRSATFPCIQFRFIKFTKDRELWPFVKQCVDHYFSCQSCIIT